MTIATEKITFSQSPSRQEYETASKPSRQEYEKSLVPQRPQVKPRMYSSDISGPFDVWAAPSDSEIWKSPGADFVAGFGAGWIKQTQVPALMGKKLPPPTTRAEKIGEGAGRAMEVITEFIGLGAILRSVGLMSKVIPKGAWAGRALQTGFLFGTQQATEEARKATAEAVYGEDFGSRGGIAILESFTFGAILSLAASGGGRVARTIWSKLKPSEQTMLLRELGLEKGATLQQINKAAQRIAAKSHFDFGRKGMNPAQIKAIETKFKQNWQKVTAIRDRLKILRSGDIIKASSKQNFKKQLMGKTGVSSEVADVAIKRLDAGESITKVDQMISQAKAGIKPLITAPPKDIVIPPTEAIVAPEPTPKPITPKKAVEVPEVKKRLRDAQKLLNPQTKRAMGAMTLEIENQRLVSKDGKIVLQYYPPNATMPDGTKAGSEGSVQIQPIAKPVAGRKAEIAPVAKAEGKVLYHGTAEQFDKFDIKKAGTIQKGDWGKGIYLTSHKGGADYYRVEAVKRTDKKLQELYKRYTDIVKKLPPVSSVNSTPKYNEESNKALKEYQDYAKELDKTSKGRVVEYNLSPDAKIMKHNTVDGITDPYLAEAAKAKGYDVLLIDEGRYTEEYVVLNSDVIVAKPAEIAPVTQPEAELEQLPEEDAKLIEQASRSPYTYYSNGKQYSRKKPSYRQLQGDWYRVGKAWSPKQAKQLDEYHKRLAQPPTVAKPEAANRYKGIDTSTKEQLLKVLYKDADVVGDKKMRAFYEELKDSFTKKEKEEFKDITGILDKQIAHDKAKVKPKPVKPKGKPGFIDVRPLLKVHKTFMGIVEPSKAVELKLGKEPYATVIKGVHQVDVGRIEFNEAQIEGQDKSLSQMSQWFSKFSDKDLKNFMISRGTPRSEEAQRIQYEARGKLPKELKRGDLFQVAQRIADSNYKYLQSVVGDDIHRVEDYFYGIWKNPKKVDKLLDYWHTTKRFTKEKKLPTVADAMDYDSTMELRSWNPIENLKAEYIAISHLEGMNWMKDELLRTGKGKYIDEMLEAPMDWDIVHDPVFKDLRLQPDLAKLINNLIATNKITQIPLLNTLREINNVARTIKFVGSAFHLLSVAKQSVADSGYLGFLYKRTALRGFTRGFRTNDPIFKTTAYKDYIRHGGGHRYSVESEARRTFNRVVNELNKNMGIAVKAGALPLKIPVSFVNWMFQSYIPKVKYSKFLDVVAGKEKKFNRKLTSPEKIDIIKEQQNFYGMMNERLFGRSGTVTSALRFYFMSPGYAEGNYRTMLKAATQWGGKTGANANRSRSNIINSWLITGTLATVGTLIFTGKLPKKPESLDDARDLFKIDTGKVDERGRRIMIDMMTYDKDYWNVAFNILRLRPDVALGESWKRIGGMKAPTAEMIVDLALMSMGKAIYDWKGDRVVEITDPFLLKAMKLTAFEIKKLSPISVSVFQQSKKRDIDTTIAAIETLLGFRPTKTEKDIREQKIISKMYSLAGQREEMSYYIGQSTDPKKTVARYNKTVNDILNSPYVPKTMKDVWGKRLLVDYDKVVTWKRFPAGKMTNAELNRAYDAHTLSVPYKRRGEPFRMIGEPRKGSERRVTELKAEAQKRGIVLKRGPRKPPRR